MQKFIEKYPETANFKPNIFGRFIGGYLYDPIEATSRMELFLAWVKENDLFNLKPSDFPNLEKHKPMACLGIGRNGHTAILLKLKHLFFTGNTPDEIARFISAYVNQSLDATCDPKVDKYILILDIKNYGSDNFSKSGLQKLLPIFSRVFPDVLYRMYIINVGFVASSIYSVISTWFPEITRKKIQVLKENLQKIKEVLSEEIELNVLPKMYGGQSDIGN